MGLPHLAEGGTIGAGATVERSGFGFSDIAGAVGDAIGDVVGALRKGAVSAIWKPAEIAANLMIGPMTTPFKEYIQGLLMQAKDWAMGASATWDEESASRVPPLQRGVHAHS